MKKRIDVTIPFSLYNKYKEKYNFSGLLSELLSNIDILEEIGLVHEIILKTTKDGKLYSVSTNDISVYLDYIARVNEK